MAHILVDDAQALYDHLVAHDVRVVKRIRDADHGMRGFVIADPDGNRLDIGESSERRRGPAGRWTCRASGWCVWWCSRSAAGCCLMQRRAEGAAAGFVVQPGGEAGDGGGEPGTGGRRRGQPWSWAIRPRSAACWRTSSLLVRASSGIVAEKIIGVFQSWWGSGSGRCVRARDVNYGANVTSCQATVTSIWRQCDVGAANRVRATGPFSEAPETCTAGGQIRTCRQKWATRSVSLHVSGR